VSGTRDFDPGVPQESSAERIARQVAIAVSVGLLTTFLIGIGVILALGFLVIAQSLWDML
jgi:hypothetical protein